MKIGKIQKKKKTDLKRRWCEGEFFFGLVLKQGIEVKMWYYEISKQKAIETHINRDKK